MVLRAPQQDERPRPQSNPLRTDTLCFPSPSPFLTCASWDHLQINHPHPPVCVSGSTWGTQHKTYGAFGPSSWHVASIEMLGGWPLDCGVQAKQREDPGPETSLWPASTEVGTAAALCPVWWVGL